MDLSMISRSSLTCELVVPVIGMHRSGTSAIAGALHAGGIAMGDEERFLPRPNAENPRGFYENFDARRINDAVLARAGYEAKSWEVEIPAARDSWLLRCRRSYLLRRYCARYRYWGWKDPRTCLTLDLWFGSLKQDRLISRTRFVLIFRHPEAVAFSLNKRDGLELRRGLQLWYEYNQRALQALKRWDISGVFVSYEELVRNPEQVLGSAESILPNGFDISAATGLIDPVLDRSGRPRTRRPRSGLEEYGDEWKGLYTQLLESARS
jgi:hypothetical protein